MTAVHISTQNEITVEKIRTYDSMTIIFSTYRKHKDIVMQEISAWQHNTGIMTEHEHNITVFGYDIIVTS